MDESVQKHLETPAKLDEVSVLLLKAANLIETCGHCKGALQDGDRFCMSGAIIFSYYGNTDSREFNEWAQPVANAWERLQRNGFCIVPWNDRPERTKEEVIARLRAVALGG